MSRVITAFFYYVFLLPLSLLPMVALYRLSDATFVLLHFIVPYRKKVILGNLRRSFPEKSSAEIESIARDYNRHLCDLVFESIKSFTISQAEISRRMRCKNPEFFAPYLERKQNVLAGGGHYGNWEWYGVAIDMQVPLKCSAIYKPLSNRFLDRKMRATRGRFGLEMIGIPVVSSWFEARKKSTIPAMLIYGCDQSPGNASKSHWMTFLNQDTACVYGLEKHAKETGYPVVYCVIRKVRRGYFEYEFSSVTDDPRSTAPGWITEEIHRRLEVEIRHEPRYWLWSHRRWKHRKPGPAAS